MSQRTFIILDRDGTINVERHYLSDPDHVELVPEAAKGLGQLKRMGLGIVVVTNQSGIGRGLFDEARLDLIHQRLQKLLAAEGVLLDGIYFCPHRPEDNCQCRKPNTGLLEAASKELDFNLQHSFVIGDKSCDIELGQRIGSTTFLVRTGYGLQTEHDAVVKPDYVVDNLVGASYIIRDLLEVEEI